MSYLINENNNYVLNNYPINKINTLARDLCLETLIHLSVNKNIRKHFRYSKN